MDQTMAHRSDSWQKVSSCIVHMVSHEHAHAWMCTYMNAWYIIYIYLFTFTTDSCHRLPCQVLRTRLARWDGAMAVEIFDCIKWSPVDWIFIPGLWFIHVPILQFGPCSTLHHWLQSQWTCKQCMSCNQRHDCIHMNVFLCLACPCKPETSLYFKWSKCSFATSASPPL